MGAGLGWGLPGQPPAELRESGDGRVTFTDGAGRSGHPRRAARAAVLRGFEDRGVLSALAGRFVQQEFAAGDVIVEAGRRPIRCSSSPTAR